MNPALTLNTTVVVLVALQLMLTVGQWISRLVRARSAAVEVRDERRDDAASIQQAIFYDLTERRRLWASNASSRVLCIILAAVLAVSISANFWLIPRASHAVVFGIAIHDNGDVTPLGPLAPGDTASAREMKAVAGHLIEDLYTVSIGVSIAESKKKVYAHVADGSPASTFVDRYYKQPTTNPFFAADNGKYQIVTVLDVGGSHDGSKATVTFLVTPVDKIGHPTGQPVRHVAHIELVQNRTGDEHVLWLNPDEVYATYIDEDGPQ